MRNSKYSTVMIGGVDYSRHFKFPFVVQKTLDESLDFAVIELHHMSTKAPFKPFTPVTIGDTLSFIVASDEVTEIYGTGLYKHIVTVMEKTKETERIMCGAKAFTNPLVRDYTDGQTRPRVTRFFNEKGHQGRESWAVATSAIWGDILGANELVYYLMRDDSTVSTPVVISDDPVIQIPKFTDVLLSTEREDLEGVYDNARVRLFYNPSETAIDYVTQVSVQGMIGSFSKTTGSTEITPDGGIEWPVDQRGAMLATAGTGIYTVRYDVETAGVPMFAFIYDVAVVAEPVTKDPYTVEDVTNQLLDTAETLRDGLDTPRYTLHYKSEEQRQRFQQDAPEFRFPNGRSLWENLREIGQFVHAIPRACHDAATNTDYIMFDDLGGTGTADLSKGERYGGGTSLSVGDYTAGLEAMAANLVNLDDVSDGSITEPYDNGYQSLRAATDEARISENTGIIKTTHPIERIIKVEVGQITVNGKTYAGGDITPYVFPKNEYDILSSYSGVYPTSKTYAVYYTQGAPNIEGLWYKAQDSGSNILNAFEQYSITNIITTVTGAPTGVFKDLDYKDLIFRVTYIPSVTARVRQYNPVYDGTFPALLAHNQSANKLSAKAFGENLRGQLAMMSKADETVTYRFRKLEDIPEPGTLYDDDRYISSITARVYHDFVLAQLNLSAGYNELGARVEINNAIRQFEIPTSEDRYTTLEEFVVLGKKESDDTNLVMNSELQASIKDAIVGSTLGGDVSAAIVTTKDDDGEVITDPSIVLPVVSLAIGTSLYFGFRFENNFAAGSRSNAGGTDKEGIEFRSQDYVKYGDEFYSHAKTIGFKLMCNTATTAYLVKAAHALPSMHREGDGDYVTAGTTVADTGEYPILWHKDSADAGCLAYQVHYMTNDNLIVGDGMAYACPAVRKNPVLGAARVYFFPHRINQLTGTTDTSTAIDATGQEVTVTDDHINGITAPSGTQSWAIIKNGRFLLGKNSSTFSDIYFNFKRRL